MYGTKAIGLLKDLQRTPLDVMPTYQEQQVRDVKEEMFALYEEVFETMRSNPDPETRNQPYIAAGLLVHHMSLLRNKRGLLAYLMARGQRAEALRWSLGTIPTHEQMAAMNPHEREYVHEYSRLLGEYNGAVEMDLTADLQPPKDLYIEVRVLKDLGEVATADGFVNLKRGSTHFLRRSMVEQLVRQGVLEHIT